MTLKVYFEQQMRSVLQELDYPCENVMVTASNRPEISDYQSNVAMSLAKVARKAPVQIAQEIKAQLEKNPAFSKVSVDGPGFINISFSDEFLSNIPHFEEFSNKKVVIDYGGPNIAKEMHVGHLRSAIIGESIKRTMRFCGDEVIGDVHFGDWGTPIGMLISQLQTEQPELFENEINIDTFSMSISEISDLYRRASAHFKADDDFKEQARVATFDLQNGHQSYRKLWKILRDKSVEAVKENYDKLDVVFDMWLGESDTNDLLPIVVDELLEKKIAQYSNGAVIVPMPDVNGKERAPLILKKSDGAYTYAATDLATIKQRRADFSPDVILYVVDARQKEHFEQVFTVARLGGFVNSNVSLEHIAFGTVNGTDGKPFKTRDGNVMNLKDLIDLSEEKAAENIADDNQNDELQTQIHQIAIGSLKFQDLKNLRTSNYIFDTENFTKSEGKTGAYIQYAVARINSILEKAGQAADKKEIKISHVLERDVMLQLHRFSEAMQQSYANREPSVLCDYLHCLSQKFSSLYAELPVNGEPNEELRNSRISLLTLVKTTLETGLNLLGIEAPERMSKRKL